MILPCGIIKLAVVYTYSPPCDCPCRDEIILLITDNNHTSFFGHHLDWTYPDIVKDRIDKPYFKQLEDFFFALPPSWMGWVSSMVVSLVYSQLPSWFCASPWDRICAILWLPYTSWVLPLTVLPHQETSHYWWLLAWHHLPKKNIHQVRG